jgi:hypothetical protein
VLVEGSLKRRIGIVDGDFKPDRKQNRREQRRLPPFSAGIRAAYFFTKSGSVSASCRNALAAARSMKTSRHSN